MPSELNLLAMAQEHGEQHALDTPHDVATFSENSLRGAGVSFHSGENFIQAWYVSNGRNISQVTYVCEWGQQDRERPTCEDIVRSIRFKPE